MVHGSAVERRETTSNVVAALRLPSVAQGIRLALRKAACPEPVGGRVEWPAMSERSESNGGGGNRTRVPRYFREGFYVRSRVILAFRVGNPTWLGFTAASREQGFNFGRAQQ